MLCEKNSNSTGLELLGFLPYVGFNLESDSIDNPVLRWKSLLEDNEHIFKDEKRVKELYDKNQHVIDHNYNRLVNTDWEAEKAAQLDRLPMFIKEYLGMLKYTTPN
jgi:urocanate hydratase